MKTGFDIQRYMEEQSKFILERVARYDKLYLEFGGKLLYDMHAKRVLPGFDENAKIKLMQHLRNELEVVICVYAGDIERSKIRGDFGIPYDRDVLRLIDDLRSYDLDINSVVITRYDNQPSATTFMNKLERRGMRVYTHRATKGYPVDVDTIVSEEGYGKNPFIETTKPLSWSPDRALEAASWPRVSASCITNTCAAVWRDTPSLKPSRSGTCR